jgi:hypothetical protein
MAVSAAAELNPDATDAELLLTAPEPLRAAVEGNLPAAASAALEHYDSDSDEDYGAFFGSRRLGPQFPPRFGYYVGYLAVQRAAASGQTLKTLAHMNLAQARETLARNLEALARVRRESTR